MSTKLDVQQKNILNLVKRSEADADGWYRVSKTLWSLVYNALPDDIAETRASKEGGYVRLTERGQAVADYL